VISDGASLTANHIQQSALLIGGSAMSSALVTIAASDADGNSLIAASGSSFEGALASGEPFGASRDEVLSAPANGDSSESDPFTRSAATVGAVPGGGATVPEPSTVGLLGLGAVCLVARWRRSRRCPCFIR